MTYCKRTLKQKALHTLKRGKSILLLGPRQTGKTTFVHKELKVDLEYSFATAKIRQRYESSLALFEKELEIKINSFKHKPIIFIDEVQKIPRVMDVVQVLIDEGKAQFILTGSSARKLKHGPDINLLPGRVVPLHMTPLTIDELPTPKPELIDNLIYGTMPGIINTLSINDKENDLFGYVETYLEDEIRAEAVVRNVGSFSEFLRIAAGESGKQLNYTKLSQDIGVAESTVTNYFQILQDCLIAHRIDPLTKTQTKRRLIKSPKFLFFDLGVRRASAKEGVQLPEKILGDLFEQFIGLQLIAYTKQANPNMRVMYWRDSAGPEVDFVLEVNASYVPIEVKWSDKPQLKDIRHLVKFMAEYNVTRGYVACRTPNSYYIDQEKKIMALPWEELNSLFHPC